MRPRRRDHPGAIHHVMNRAVGHRSLIETQRDADHLLERAGELVEDGYIEIYAYSLQTTHVHFILGSPQGRLDVGMRLMEDDYARWFNRTRDRDGPLFRGRYLAKIIEGTDYLDQAIWYVDRNAVESGLVLVPADYPLGSAYHFHRPPGPRWLSRSVVEQSWIRHHGGPFDPQRYGTEVVTPKSVRLWRIMKRHFEGNGRACTDFRSLISAAPGFVRDWLVERARIADGGPTGTLLLDGSTVVEVLAGLRSPEGGGSAARTRAADWSRLTAGLLYSVCGLTTSEVAALVSAPVTTTGTHIREYRKAIIADDGLRALAAEAIRAGIAIDYAPLAPRSP